MRRAIALGAGMAALLAPGAAWAGELFGGLYRHDVPTFLNKSGNIEGGIDFQLGWRGGRIGPTPLRPYVFGALNSDGGTSYGAAGLSARFDVGRLYVRPGLGLALHSGSAHRFFDPSSDSIAFGSRVLFEPELGIGLDIAPRASAEISWVHMSHAQLFSRENPGIDNIGVRLNLAL